MVFEMVENILIEVLGRPAMAKPESWDEVFKKWKQGEITAVEGMKLTGLSKNVFYKFVRENK